MQQICFELARLIFGILETKNTGSASAAGLPETREKQAIDTGAANYSAPVNRSTNV
jgi:hypothetical protein